MDQTLAILTSFPPAGSAGTSDRGLDGSIKDYLAKLRSLDSGLKEQVLSDPSRALKLLDPSINTIGYLAVLDLVIPALDPNARTASSTIDRNTVLDATLDFILRFDTQQIRYVGPQMLSLLERIGGGQLFSPRVAIELLSTAIFRIDPSGSIFTSTHLVLLNLAYQTACIEPVMEIIDHELIHYPKTSNTKPGIPVCSSALPLTTVISPSTGLTRDIKSSSVLEYNLLRGLVYMSKRDWVSAKRTLEKVITHPSKDNGVSKIATEAYKKWLLVGLLCDGKAPSIPPHVSHSAKVAWTHLAEPYIQLSDMFSAQSTAELHTQAQVSQAVWLEDGNSSLVAEVLASYQKWQIINLKRIYSELPVSRILALTSSAETGQPLASKAEVTALIQGMIESKMLRGELVSGEDGEDHLSFHAERALLTEQDFAQMIAESHETITTLGHDYKLVNDRLSNTKDYVRYHARESRRTDKDGEPMSAGFDMQIEDEDLMSGIAFAG